MQKITLYHYNRPDGGVTVSPVMPDAEYSVMHRLVADKGMLLTDGVNSTTCVDTDNPDAWAEVTDAEDPNEATEADYQAALRDMGVEYSE